MELIELNLTAERELYFSTNAFKPKCELISSAQIKQIQTPPKLCFRSTQRCFLSNVSGV